VVVLKRLADARRDGDAIHGVILGSATNNDGSARPGFATPGRTGKAAVVAEALAMAGVPADTIGYIEGHGMATTTGDAVEVSALAGVLRPRTGKPCLLGSVTANVGHLETAAGMAGLIKALTMLRTGEIPPQIDFDRPNPVLAEAYDVLRVSTERVAWPEGDGPRRAGVSIFGIGGVNVHVLAEQPPAPAERAPVAGPDLVVLSARTPQALADMTARLLARLLADPDLCLGDLAYTLQTGRTPFAVRRVILAHDRAHLITALSAPEPPIVLSRDHVPVVLDMPEAGPTQVRVHPSYLLDSPQPDRLAAARAVSALAHPAAVTGDGAAAQIGPVGGPAPAGAVVVEVGTDGGVRVRTGADSPALSLTELAGRLWGLGVAPHWPVLHRHATRRRVRLPTYPFERTAHWVAPSQQTTGLAGQRFANCRQGAMA
jgi:acyl transferase domain-containing protein